MTAYSAVTAFVSAENPYRIANGITLETAGVTVVDFSDVVAAGGTKTFTNGADAIILDGPKANYEIQVDSTGKTTIKDVGTGDFTYGQTITVTGESYIVFNGSNLAASTVMVSGAPTYPNDAYFVENPANAQLAQFYAAMLQRSPDMGGLEYWENTLAAWTPTMGATGAMVAVANDFLSIIHSSYSTGSPIATLGGDPATMSNTQFVTALYGNVLGRVPDAAGLAYWVSSLDSGTATQAEVLVNFTNAMATTSAVNLSPGSTPGSSTGWLINYSLTGGYADPGIQEAATTVLTNAASSRYLDTSLIDVSSITTTATTVGPFTAGKIGSAGLVTVATTGSNDTIVLSASITTATASGSSDTIISPSTGGGSIYFTGNNGLVILHGNSNLVSFHTNYVTPITGSNVIGWNSTDTIVLQNASVDSANGAFTSILTPLSAINGSALNFLPGGAGNGYATYVINVGNVGGGTNAEVAAAANAVYHPTGAFGESIIFVGTTNTGDAVVDLWGAWGSNGLSGASQANANTGDTNGNHLVDANEITASVVLVSVTASSLAITNFYHH